MAVSVCFNIEIISFLLCSLRTSETNYLHEAFSFYTAIRARGYFSKVNREKRLVDMYHWARVGGGGTCHRCVVHSRTKIKMFEEKIASIFFQPYSNTKHWVLRFQPCKVTAVFHTHETHDSVKSYFVGWEPEGH